MKLSNTVSLALERYAERRGISNAHSHIAKELGVCRQTVWLWCSKNSVSPKYVERFAFLTGVRASELNQLTRKIC